MFFPPTLIPSSSLRGSTLGKRRNFTTLNPALQQHFHILAWKPATSFTISRDFATTASEDEFLAGTAEAADTIVIDLTADKVRAFCYVGTAIQGVLLEGMALAHNDGKLRNITITWDDATNIAELLIDGVSAGTTTWLIDGNQDVKYAGKRHTAYGSNVVGEIKLTDGVDNRWYTVDEDWVENDILVNRAVSLGVESWNDAPTRVVAGWVDNLDGSYSCDGTSGAVLGDNANTIANNDSMIVTYEVSGYVAGAVRMLIFGSSAIGEGNFRSANGVYAEVVHVTAATGDRDPTGELMFQSDGVGFAGTVSNVSARKAPGYGTAVNITDADAEVFTEHKEVSPNEWRNADNSVVIPIAGT